MRQVVYLQDAIGLRKKALDRWAQLSPLQRVPVVLTANAIACQALMRLDIADATIVVLELALNEEVGLHWR
jgi:hypothetical protein